MKHHLASSRITPSFGHHHLRPFLLKAAILAVFGLLAGVFAGLSAWGQQPEGETTSRPADDPAVAAILALKPESPRECLRAALTLTDLKRPDLAKSFLKKVLDAKLTEKQLADLAEEFGSGALLALSLREELQPEAKQLATAAAEALKKRREDAKRIESLIRQLQDPDEQKRAEALAGLLAAPSAALGPLLKVLSDSDRSAERAGIRTVLSEFGPLAQAPLLTLAAEGPPKLKAQAILTLGEMKDPAAAVWLYAPLLAEESDAVVRQAAAVAIRRLGGLPSRDAAVQALRRLAEAYFDQRQPIAGAFEGRVEWWSWDAQSRQCKSERLSLEEASRRMAARAARDAYLISSNDPFLRILYLTTKLECAAYAKGLDRPWASDDAALAEAERFGWKTCEEVLKFSLEHRHPAAAAAAAYLLGSLGSAEEVLFQGVRPAPLVEALSAADRRLRLAAAAAIVRLQPSKPFPGAGGLLETLGYFVASRGLRTAVVASPNADTARDLAGRLKAAGYDTRSFSTGREMLLSAARDPDCELALIDVTIDRPTADLLLQQLRHEPRTAQLRVGLIAPVGKFERAEHIARNDPLARAFAKPHDDQAFAWQWERLDELLPEGVVSREVRLSQAARALDLLAELAAAPSKLYDLRRLEEPLLSALLNDALALKAIAILGEVNSAACQRALVAAAGACDRPQLVRQAAVAAFRKHVEQFGLLLTLEEIQRQYDRYNSETQAASRQMLGTILDCIESRHNPER